MVPAVDNSKMKFSAQEYSRVSKLFGTTADHRVVSCRTQAHPPGYSPDPSGFPIFNSLPGFQKNWSHQKKEKKK